MTDNTQTRISARKIIPFLFCLGLLLSNCRPMETPTPTSKSVRPTEEQASTTVIPTETSTETGPPPSPEEILTIQPYLEANLTGSLVFYADWDGNPDIYILDFTTGEITQLTDNPAFDDSPALSSDGSRIVFLTARHDPSPTFPNLKYELYVMNSDGTNQQRMTETDAAEGHPAWAPDGSQILFDADYDEDGFAEIYTLSLDDGDLTRLTFNAANDQFADWSPDGSRIAFSSDRSGNWDVYVMDADGANQMPLTTSLDWELFPAWSPDGTQIAFNYLVPRSRNTDVYVMGADGSDPRQLTDSPGFDENPAWSPDGTKIAFQTNRDGNFAIYIMDPDGRHPLSLTDFSSDELWPSWGMTP